MTKQPYDPAYRGSSASHPARNEGGHPTLSRLSDLSGKAAVVTGATRSIGEPGEIAGTAVFLASPAGSFTGQTFVIDGGYTVQGP